MVSIKVIENVFTKEEKQLMIEKVTSAMVSIEGDAMRDVTWVCIEDVKEGEFGIGGKALTADMIHALQRGEAA